MKTFNESGLVFEFETPPWDIVFQFDTHKAYLDLSKDIPETKAVDFIGVKAEFIHFIEVKNLRHVRIESKPRLDGELWIEVAQKVRDTLACLFARALRDAEHEFSRLCEQALKQRQFYIWLWLEEDSPPPSPSTWPKAHNKLKRNSGNRGIYTQALRKKLQPWLAASAHQVKIYQIEDFPTEQGLKVSYRPGA